MNIGSNYELSIAELAKKIADTVGYNGKILFDAGKPDGAFRKILDISVVKKIGKENTMFLINLLIKI